MGFAASQARFLILTARKSDMELQGQFINQQRLFLANITQNLFMTSSNLEPDSREMVQINLRIQALQSLDKSLEIQLKRVDTQRDAIQTEMDAVRKVIGKNIASTYKTFG